MSPRQRRSLGLLRWDLMPLLARRRVGVTFAPVVAVSDLGGRAEHFGPITREPDEPVFHAHWERRVVSIMPFGFLLAAAAIELLASRWSSCRATSTSLATIGALLGGFERQLVGAGDLGADEVDARVEGRAGVPGRRRVSRLRLAVISRVVCSMLRPALPALRGTGTSRPGLSDQRFSVGDSIRVRDRRAPEHCYTVAFAVETWSRSSAAVFSAALLAASTAVS
jgi:hypothetical protein